MDIQFDLIAIGGGSGGLAVAERAAQHGARVAIVEPHELGGTCVHRGCVPKKIMWYAAHLAHAVDLANDFGIPASRGATDWHQLVGRRQSFIENIVDYWNSYVDDNRIQRIDGSARFIDAHTIAVQGRKFSAPHLVIATGGRPIIPQVPGAELGITSDGFFELTEQPRRVAVVGTGYIGVELACMLRALGSDVTLIGRGPRILRAFDDMISDVLTTELRAQSIALHASVRIAALTRSDDAIAVDTVGGDRLDGFTHVIWAVGRAPNTDALDLGAAGIDHREDGIVPTDSLQNTNVPGVYAVGDITGRAQLTPVAIAAGRRLADRLFGGRSNSRVDYDAVPSVVFSHPPVGTVGLTERQARERHAEVTIYKTDFVPMRHALSAHGATTAMKLVCVGQAQRVVGIHLIGDSVDEMLQGFAVAVKMGATKADLDGTIAIHPVSAEELVTMKSPEPEREAETRSRNDAIDPK